MNDVNCDQASVKGLPQQLVASDDTTNDMKQYAPQPNRLTEAYDRGSWVAIAH